MHFATLGLTLALSLTSLMPSAQPVSMEQIDSLPIEYVLPFDTLFFVTAINQRTGSCFQSMLSCISYCDTGVVNGEDCGGLEQWTCNPHVCECVNPACN